MSNNFDQIALQIQKILYNDLNIWKERINDLESGNLDKNTFKQLYIEYLQKAEAKITNYTTHFLKRESFNISRQIVEDNLRITTLLETIDAFLDQKRPLKSTEKENQFVPITG